jgi:hypothetical protein
VGGLDPATAAEPAAKRELAGWQLSLGGGETYAAARLGIAIADAIAAGAESGLITDAGIASLRRADSGLTPQEACWPTIAIRLGALAATRALRGTAPSRPGQFRGDSFLSDLALAERTFERLHGLSTAGAIDRTLSDVWLATLRLLRSLLGCLPHVPAPAGGMAVRGTGSEPAGGEPDDGSLLERAILDLESIGDGLPNRCGSSLARALPRALYHAYRAWPGEIEFRAAAVDAGLAALTEEAAAVLLSAGDAYRPASTPAAVEFACGMALDCVETENPEAAMAALELGHGRWPTAAAEASTGAGPADHAVPATDVPVAELLSAVRRPDLAAEWRRRSAAGGPPEADDDLAARVVTALAGTASGHALLHPPTVVGIAQALRIADRDALAYLLPGAGDRSGWALLVTRDGGLRSLPLPELTLGGDGPLDGSRPTSTPTVTAGAAPAVPASLLEAFQGNLGRRVSPRLTVVRCGPLAAPPRRAVPAGAPRTAGRSPRQASITYAATARQFVDQASRSTGGAGLDAGKR